MKSYHVRVIGRVQGVGFRYYTLEQARSLGISGWVKNLPDGSVEITATGQEQDMNIFLENVKKGPSFSRVTDMIVNEVPEPVNLKKSQFRIV